MAKEVVMIDVDDLGIDTTNIRGGKWDYKEDFVQDIKNNGILNPLIVRRAHPKTGKKYAIVCGSRRYNAAIEAGLTKVPCFVEEMDDVTAIGRTVAENIHRTDIPAWMFALKIGEMYEKLDGKATKPERVKIIEEKTGLASSGIYEYLDVCGLPAEIIELLKEPVERSEKVKELIKSFRVTEELKALSIQKAAIIARELIEYPLKKMLEVAVFVVDKSVDATRELVRLVKTYPKMSMEGLYDKYIGIPKGARWFFEFGSHIVAALDEACMRKNIDRKSLVVRYVEDGLRRDGFL